MPYQKKHGPDSVTALGYQAILPGLHMAKREIEGLIERVETLVKGSSREVEVQQREPDSESTPRVSGIFKRPVGRPRNDETNQAELNRRKALSARAREYWAKMSPAKKRAAIKKIVDSRKANTARREQEIAMRVGA